MSERPQTFKQLDSVYQSMNRHLQNPDSWKPLDLAKLSSSKCLCIYTMGQWKLMPGIFQRLLNWLQPLREYGILYDVAGKEQGRLHFTSHQCSGFDQGPFQEYRGTFLDSLLQELSGLKIVFRGLLVTPTGIALRGFPSTEFELKKLMKVRTQLASCFKEAGVPFQPPYMNDICHATLFRWTKTPSEFVIKRLQTDLYRWEEAVLAELCPFQWNFGYGTLTMLPDEIDVLHSVWTPLHIAHRGLIKGPDSSLENSVETLTLRKNSGLHSEIDIWWKDNSFWIGHDEPREKVSIDFLTSPYFWIHAKHQESFEELQRVSNECGLGLRIFYHTDEDYVLTTHGDTIIYPGLEDCHGWVYMMPEMGAVRPSKAAAICSDFA